MRRHRPGSINKPIVVSRSTNLSARAANSEMRFHVWTSGTDGCCVRIAIVQCLRCISADTLRLARCDELVVVTTLVTNKLKAQLAGYSIGASCRGRVSVSTLGINRARAGRVNSPRGNPVHQASVQQQQQQPVRVDGPCTIVRSTRWADDGWRGTKTCAKRDRGGEHALFRRGCRAGAALKTCILVTVTTSLGRPAGDRSLLPAGGGCESQVHVILHPRLLACSSS